MMLSKMVRKLFHSVLLATLILLPKHKDEERKQRYIARHIVNQDWKDYSSGGFWAKHILWKKHTVEASVRDTDKRF